MKVTLVIYGLSGGGAERVMSILANYWVERGWEVTLMMLVDATQSCFYPLDPRIQLKSLGLAKSSANWLTAIYHTWQRVMRLRREIIADKPDVVISFMTAVNVYAILAGWNLDIPTIVGEHTYPGATDANKIWQLLMKWFYRYADRIAVLTQNAVPFYPATQGYRTIVLPNPVLSPPPAVPTPRLLPVHSLIAVGRLDPRKGFDLLLRAFHQIRDRYPDWQLTILGEGAIRAELEDLRSQLQLTDCVHLPGAVQNVPDYLYQADLFVLPSRVEGFPMALCEAMACGVPVLAADCLSGPRDIIEDGVNGILVPPEDVDALAAGLDALMSDPAKRQYLAQNAPQVLDRFGLERIAQLWTEAIDKSIYDRQYRRPRIAAHHHVIDRLNALIKN
ncbi:glycosyltransferase family 4 protein [Chamaesiphon sp. VAR_69_metabat_338]|uniref:glycosyltransferase family 4 protein n=1 Tax=Chamaesiphon sp. VAR_69_metabat_338 TaxID=2964704 RepID=UPI00286DE6AE|nr:glycosyltransferase family 4 protein [Chamaesiphon sp. VAR_69_metabat_338]